jgi:hypothetical protein
MNRKPNVPGEIEPGPQYSFGVDGRVNAWMYVAMAISVATDLFYRNEVRAWPDFLRALAAVAPLLAILMWIRRLARWIRGMDELHRSITRAACLFATAATFFFITAWHHLSRLEVLHAIFSGRMKAYASVDLCVPWLILWLLLISYIVGQRIFNRRYA